MRAWIEKPDGTRVEITGTCFFGRAPGNTVVLESPSTSRRHAQIQVQSAIEGPEYWIVDLGSTNGTGHNGRRVTIPCQLTDGDIISCGDEKFVFHAERPAAAGPHANSFMPATTVKVFAPELCWLLMLDIKRYTDLACRMEVEPLSLMVGRWFRRCRDAIESNGGTVDKFLGDAVFAYWKQRENVAASVSRALFDISELQQERDPDFRIVVHLGHVALEGGIGGANNVSGPEVICVFRMEKVCARLEGDSIVSAPARTALNAHWRCTSLGAQPLDGFSKPLEMFQLVNSAGPTRRVG